MKKKIFKILGIAVTLGLVFSFVFAALPAHAAVEKINEWYTFDYPAAGSAGDWFRQGTAADGELITAIGPIAEAINGDLYAGVSHTPFILDGEAEWTRDEIPPEGDYSVKLETESDEEWATVWIPVNIPLADIDSLSFWYKQPGSTSNPYFLLAIDTDSDGFWDWSSRDWASIDFTTAPENWTQGDGDDVLLGSFGKGVAAPGWTKTDLSDVDVWYPGWPIHDGDDWLNVPLPAHQGNLELADWQAGPVSSDEWGMYDSSWIPTGDFDFSDMTVLAIGVEISGYSGTQTAYVASIEINDKSYDLEYASASLFKSTDGARTWEETDYAVDTGGGPIVDMVCSSIDEDTLYVTDGNYVYKTTDGGDEWDFVGKDSLETVLEGECGCPVIGHPITSIDVGYDDDDNPFVFIGTRSHWSDLEHGCAYDDWVSGDVYYMGEAGYPANWTSLNLSCYGGGGYDALAVGCAPDWADTKETYVVVTNYSDTHVVYTKGTICGWYEFAELLWDCTDSFGSLFASRIGFPDDWEDTETLFVGVVDVNPCDYDGDPPIDEQGGDVYLATDGDAIDLNVAGIITGCQGKESVDIISLDVEGDTDEARLIAGAFCDAHVYCSEDGGWSWDESDKDPTGEMLTYVIFYEDTALAATAGCECAVSMCCGEDYPCEFWNQISLIATDIDQVLYIDHSPGYVCEDSETMFMLTGWGVCAPITSLFRYDGTYWERVFCSTVAGWDDGPFTRVRVSPDFNETNCVYVTNRYFEMWRTTDAGCSWDKLTFPCAPRDMISAAIVIDEDTVLAGGLGVGTPAVFKTTRHGARPWKEYELPEGAGLPNFFALEPDYEDPGTVLLGDDIGHVFISEDGGETWDLVGEAIVGSIVYYPVWVTFDPGYATNHIIYAATGDTIARCIIDPDEDWDDQEWEDIGFDYCGYSIDLGEASGIAAAGDTALYVADGIGERTGVFRSLNPDAEDADDVVFEELTEGLDYTPLRHLWLTCDTSDDGCAENVLWSLEQYFASPENIWVYEDTLAQPVVLDLPVDEQKLTKTTEATLSWNKLCGADCYEVSLYAYCAECPDEKLEVSVPCTDDCCLEEIDGCFPECTTDETCIVVDDLDPGTTYYWQIRVCYDSPKLSKWSEERSFTTALLPVPFAELCSPECGAQDIILTPNFAWEAVDGATSYDVQLSTTETFTVGVVKGKTSVNAWVCPTTLEYATTYYWRVRAVKDGIYSDWTYCMFTTMAEPVPPTPPVVVEQVPPSPPPVINIPPAEMITPTWIYAIIGVGAALAIVVIVLIVRTRRPPA